MAKIIKIQDEFSFIPRSEHTILEALEAQNVATEYQCRQGFCGICQVTLLDGEVDYIEEPIAFIGKGKILPCCCTAKTDITIELPYPASPTDTDIE
ncbi:2Fe-2S ferredoxin-like protein [Zooshikella marina]|uniref:class I ribonucleotide reductase maintenance protein YfaE n=1 Tax=Zooshikella ganghwensis TaxID=202772 RepID=UPI001BAF9BE1|nr:class I ribonucleotide reductase maintenance protein YfaE [Zooshikella ganghwensis]MBU2704780.1 2Fe-2S ferredoxin-like protein [Zooshikella ganghwensis]